MTTQAVGEELLVYDLERHQLHTLNSTAAFVWSHCDGQTSIADMTMLVHRELDLEPDRQIVCLALDQLQRARLLKEPVEWTAESTRCTRREMVRKLGLAGAAAALLPVVQSIVAPTPAAAASGGNGGKNYNGKKSNGKKKAKKGNYGKKKR